MSTSQNGWLANNRSVVASYSVPGGKIAMRKGDVATVLVYFAKRYHSEVEPLKWPGNWGYAERKIRGSSSTLSNHASGTALDLNAPRHPLGKSGTFSSAQVRAIDKILSDCGGVLRHGKNYRGRKDEMHVEINAGSAAVRRVAQAIRAGKKPGPSGGATASVGGGSSYGSATAKHKVGSRVMVKYDGGTDVEWLQKRLYKLGWDIDYDGLYGSRTVTVVKALQRNSKLKQDGEAGPKTIAAAQAAKAVRDLPKAKASSQSSFPLPKGHYYYTESSSNKVHSGYWEKDRPAIRKIQKKVGTGVDGGYGANTKSAVNRWQGRNGLKRDGAFGADSWKKAF